MTALNDFNTKTKKPWEVEGVEWKEMSLTDIVEILDNERVPVKKKERKPGPYPYCGANGIIDYVDGYTHEGEYLLLAEDGGFFGNGEPTAYIMNGKFWANNHVHILKATPDIFFKFLYHFSIFYDFTPHLGGATRPKLSQTGMRRIKVPLPFRNGKPDLETQKKIVEYIEANFSRIEKILEKKRREFESLDELWESVLEEAFKPKEGEEWREVRLGEIAEVVRGVNFTTQEILSIHQGEPVITASNIRGDFLIKENLIFVPFTKVKAEQKIKQGDIVIVMSTGSKIALGRTYYSPNDEDVYIGAFLGIIRYKMLEINPKFVYFFTKTAKFRTHLLNYTGSQINNISMAKLTNLKLPLPFRYGNPDLEKQKEIANYLDSVYEKIKILKEKIQNQITKLEEMKESILDEAFNHDSNI